MITDIHKEGTDELLPKSFDPLLQKKAMLEGELARLDDRSEALRSALELVNKYEEGLNSINTLRNPKIQVREGEGRIKVFIEVL